MDNAIRFHTTTAFAACLAVTLNGCAGVAALNNSTTKEKIPMSMEDEQKKAPRPPISAETILSSLVQLLDGSRSAKDFTPDRLTAAFGEPLNFDGARFGFGGPLTPEWRYGINVEPETMSGPMLLLNFAPSVRDQEPDATPICKVDLDDFSRRLEKIGFSRDVRYGEHGQIIAFEFTRSALQAIVDVRGEASDPPEKVSHLCVMQITVR